MHIYDKCAYFVVDMDPFSGHSYGAAYAGWYNGVQSAIFSIYYKIVFACSLFSVF